MHFNSRFGEFLQFLETFLEISCRRFWKRREIREYSFCQAFHFFRCRFKFFSFHYEFLSITRPESVLIIIDDNLHHVRRATFLINKYFNLTRILNWKAIICNKIYICGDRYFYRNKNAALCGFSTNVHHLIIRERLK